MAYSNPDLRAMAPVQDIAAFACPPWRWIVRELGGADGGKLALGSTSREINW